MDYSAQDITRHAKCLLKIYPLVFNKHWSTLWSHASYKSSAVVYKAQ